MSSLDPQFIGPGNAGGGLPTGNDQAASANIANETRDPDEFCARFRQWYAEAMSAPLWKEWVAESDEDMDFYIGGKRQWQVKGSYADYDKLVGDKRSAVSINHIMSIVDILSGYERGNRLDIKAMPQGDGDNEPAQLMSHFLKYAEEQTNATDILSEMFEDGNIRGMDVAKIGVDYTGEKPVNGEIFITRLQPGPNKEVIWDPYWTKYDLSDARYIIESKWAFLLDLEAEYPEYKAQLREAVGQLRQVMGDNKSSARTGKDNYGFVRGHPVESLEHERMFYDERDNRLLVCEVYYHVYETKFSVFDRKSGKIEKCDTYGEAATLVASDPDNMKLHRSESKRVRMGSVIPATYTTLEEDKNPHPNDDTNYPYVPYIAKRKSDVIFGIVRNLKDPQRIENKRWSQAIDTLRKWAYIRPLVPKGSLTHPDTINDASADSPLIYDKEKGEPTWYVAPVSQINGVMTTLAEQMKLSIREISGVNADLLGQKQDTSSGIAIARRQQQGQVVSTVYFDNLRKTRKLMGQRLARRIQQVYTVEDTIRLTNEHGGDVVVRINPMNAKGERMTDDEFKQFAQAQEAAGKPKVLRDVTSLKYDIIVSEAPATPTARAAALMALLEIAEKVPQLVPVMLDYIVELADVPNREELLQRVKAMMGAAGGGPAAPKPPNPAGMPEASGGTPPGVPPAGAAMPGAAAA